MKFSLIVLFAFVAYLSMAAADLDSEWNDYKEKFNKNYNEEEEKMRKELFAEHLTKVAEHNKKFDAGEVSFTIGVNQFADLTPDERKKLHPSGVVLPSAAKED